METNREIIRKAAINTRDFSGGGLLNPEQSKQFLRQVFDSTEFIGLIRRETRTAKNGEIDKIGINRRILRLKTEGTDDDYRAGVNPSAVPYSTVAVRVPWEITEETLRQNIEKEGFEKTVTELMTKQVGLDLIDLLLNADSATDSSDPDYDFLKVNDGWIKLLSNGGHIEDRTSKDGGALSANVFYDGLETLPSKYNNGNLRWIMSPKRKQEWEKYLVNQMLNKGGVVPESMYKNPASIPAVEVPSMADDKIILTDPKNLIAVNTYEIKIRKTVEGKDAIMQDKRFYVIHLDFDAIIEELDAAVLIKGLK